MATVKVYSEELDEAAYRDGMKATEFNWNKYTDLQQNLYFLKNNFRPVFGFPLGGKLSNPNAEMTSEVFNMMK